MSKKTNKTSHVMDLLTNGASTDADTPVAEAVLGQEKKPSDIQSHSVTPAKVTVVDEGSRNDRLSQEILGKLTEELEEETRQEEKAGQGADEQTAEPDVREEKTSAASPAPPQETVADTNGQAVDAPNTASPDEAGMTADAQTDIPKTDASAQDAVNTAPEDTPEITSDASQDLSKEKPASPKAKPHPIIPESQFNDRFTDKEYRFINVMEQLLMRQNLEAVLTQYDVCTCPRCMSDVCALVLTGLPSKYVVTSRDSISPLISYYENKYKIPVLTELMKACDRVRQNPRHKVSH